MSRHWSERQWRTALCRLDAGRGEPLERHWSERQWRTRQATRIGPNTATLVDVILRERTHPEQGFRSCLGIVRLAKPHGREALEAACLRALESSPCGRHRSEAHGGHPLRQICFLTI